MLYAQAEGLRIAMAAGYAPFPAAVYNSHDQVKMSLPAISVGFLSGKSRENLAGFMAGIAPSIVGLYDFEWDIRVHTDYQDGYHDETKVSRLLNSISNWLQTHKNLSIPGFQYLTIDRIEGGAAFPESLTIGGFLIIKITVALAHEQAS